MAINSNITLHQFLVKISSEFIFYCLCSYLLGWLYPAILEYTHPWKMAFTIMILEYVKSFEVDFKER